jgi:hypothetical protein
MHDPSRHWNYTLCERKVEIQRPGRKSEKDRFGWEFGNLHEPTLQIRKGTQLAFLSSNGDFSIYPVTSDESNLP